jgi:hypothetical protein
LKGFVFVTEEGGKPLLFANSFEQRLECAAVANGPDSKCERKSAEGAKSKIEIRKLQWA